MAFFHLFQIKPIDLSGEIHGHSKNCEDANTSHKQSPILHLNNDKNEGVQNCQIATVIAPRALECKIALA
jgi:hypothetical protein